MRHDLPCCIAYFGDVEFEAAIFQMSLLMCGGYFVEPEVILAVLKVLYPLGKINFFAVRVDCFSLCNFHTTSQKGPQIGGKNMLDGFEFQAFGNAFHKIAEGRGIPCQKGQGLFFVFFRCVFDKRSDQAESVQSHPVDEFGAFLQKLSGNRRTGSGRQRGHLIDVRGDGFVPCGIESVDQAGTLFDNGDGGLPVFLRDGRSACNQVFEAFKTELINDGGAYIQQAIGDFSAV